MAQDKHLAFRESLNELQNQEPYKNVYKCNKCEAQITTRYHCTACDVSKLNFNFVTFCIKYLSLEFSFRTSTYVRVAKKI